MATFKPLLDEELRAQVEKLEAPKVIKQAMNYSLEAGGKRIRPLLLFATLDAFNVNPANGLLPAAAVEMIHTYSLIHDDLPSMDDDDLRRGKPTNHKVFGEAYAILAGDALLTYSFQLIGEMERCAASDETKLKLILEMAKAAGAEGMVGGQVADMDGENKQLALEEVEYIHIHKTGKLLAFCVIAGALMAEAEKEQIDLLAAFAHHLGLAFQIRDDILDVEGSEELIGKPVGSDKVNQKSTYPFLLTIEGAKRALNQHIELAKESLRKTNLQAQLLFEITDLIAFRNH
ncbi:MAG: polyprenyl synthetase family protein [Bacillota bacterium]|nr:polyprenyl synthetase family protein [Bacillota bacterium]